MKFRRVRDLVAGQTLLTLPATATVREAARLMAERRVGAVLVVSPGNPGERLEGIFTERDVLNRVVAAGNDPESTRLDAVMTADPRTVTPIASALDALRAMHDGGFRHLPVIEAGRLIGVVSLRDFLASEFAELESEMRLRQSIANGGQTEA